MTAVLTTEQIGWLQKTKKLAGSSGGPPGGTLFAGVSQPNSAEGQSAGGSGGQPNATARAERGHVKIGKPIVSTDRKQASEEGEAVGKLLRGGKLKTDDKEQVMHLLSFYEGPAYEAFVDALDGVLAGTGGAVQTFNDEESQEHIFENNEAITTEDETMIIPMGEPQADRGGFKVQYSAQIYEETSESTAVEVYTDVSGGGGVSLEIPIKKVLKLKLSADAKHGRKTSDKSETKQATRTGQTISRTFTVRHMQREVVNVKSKKLYHGEGPIAKSVTHELSQVGPDTQHGYMVVPDEGGAPWGPFWEQYKQRETDDQSGLRQAWEVLAKEQKQIAEDLAFGPPDG
jgi:hypothetical protein